MSTMLRWSLLSVLGSVLACGGTESPSGAPVLDVSVSQDRIVGGAAFAGLPAVGSLTINGSNWCTGTLIGKRKVVTAAHCLDDYAANQYKFAIGPNASSPTKVYNVVGGIVAWADIDPSVTRY